LFRSKHQLRELCLNFRCIEFRIFESLLKPFFIFPRDQRLASFFYYYYCTVFLYLTSKIFDNLSLCAFTAAFQTNSNVDLLISKQVERMSFSTPSLNKFSNLFLLLHYLILKLLFPLPDSIGLD